jgi:alkaline phosphatase
MKLRNRLIALACLVVFVAMGIFFFRGRVSQKPFAIILFVSDGLAAEQVTAARLFAGGADYKLSMEQFPRIALLSNHANDYAVPDAASAATALATGRRVNNRHIATDADGKWLRSIVELAQHAGRSTGLITSGRLTDAGAAAFYAHEADARNTESIAAQFSDDRELDVTFAGGAQDFLPEGKGGARKDGRDLILEMRNRGVEVVRSREEFDNTALFRTSRLVALLSREEFAPSRSPGRVEPALAELVTRAIESLQFDANGYLLVVDAALAGRAAERNDAEGFLSELLALDEAVAAAREYAGENALILVAGRHSVGGMTLNGFPLRDDRGVTLLGTTPFGHPAITWATGPNGPSGAPVDPARPTSPAAFYLPSAVATAGDMLLLGAGPGSEKIQGFSEAPFVFKLVEENL